MRVILMSYAKGRENITYEWYFNNENAELKQILARQSDQRTL